MNKVVYGGPDDTGGVDGAVLADVMNAADNGLDANGGSIRLHLYGSHNLTSVFSQGKKTRLRGLGTETTILNVVGNHNAIDINPTQTNANWSIEDLQIDMNQVTGDGIASTHASGDAEHNSSYIKNIKIWDVKAGQAGINLDDIYTMWMNQITIRTYGTGILLGKNAVAYNSNHGNSLIERIHITLRANNAVGVDLQASASYAAATLTTFNHLQVWSSTATGTIGFRNVGKNYYTTITQPILENMGKAVYLEDTRNVNIYNPYFGNIGTYSIQLEGDTYGVNTWGGRMSGNYWDNSTAAGNDEKNIINGTFLISNTNNGQWNWTQFASGTVKHNTGGTYYLDDYQVIAGAGWSNPVGPAWNGRRVIMRNTGAGQSRLWGYSNGAWVALATV